MRRKAAQSLQSRWLREEDENRAAVVGLILDMSRMSGIGWWKNRCRSVIVEAVQFLLENLYWCGNAKTVTGNGNGFW
jgi:hypothetical protein